MKTNSDVTDALRRTVSLMQSELERSVLTTQMLDSSTATLRSTSLQHDALNSVMSTSKQLITALEKSDWVDRILIISGFVFFLLVVLFILKQRIIDRGLRVAFWWTRFIPDFSSMPMSNIPDRSPTLASSPLPTLAISSLPTLAISSSLTLAISPLPTLAISKDSLKIVDTQSSFLPQATDGPEVVSETTYQAEQTPTSLPDHIEL